MADVKGYVVGDWNAYCDYCEGQYLASQLRTDYWGFKACPKDFTKPNPQMFVRPAYEKVTVAWTRPTDGTDQFIIGPTTVTNGSTTELFVTGNGGVSVDGGVTLYDYSCAAGTATINLHDPSFATLNIDRQISITCSAMDSSGNASTGTLTISVQIPSIYTGSTTILNGATAVILMSRSKRSWTRIV